MSFIKKIYFNDALNTVSNESVTIPISDEAVYIEHDNAIDVEIYTQLDKAGSAITDFTVTNDSIRLYRQILHFGTTARSTYGGTTAYANYTSLGDEMDDMVVNRIESEIARHEANDPHNIGGLDVQIENTVPVDSATGVALNSTVIVNFNKWIDKQQSDKLKVYSDAGRTVEVSGVVTRSGNKQMTFTPSGSLSALTTYYARVVSGVSGIDGTILASNYDFIFTTTS